MYVLEFKYSLCQLLVSLVLLSVFDTTFAEEIPPSVVYEINEIVDQMDRKDIYGQKLLVGMPWAFRNGQAEPDEETVSLIVSLLTKYKVGNFQLSDWNYQDWHAHNLGDTSFRERPNVETIGRQTALLRRLLMSANVVAPPIIAVDWEGGQVQHFRHDTLIRETPSPMNFTAADPTGATIERFGAQSGKLLRSVGITTNFAPLLDVTTEKSESIIGTRSFSSQTALVEVMANSYVRGLASEGVAPVFKHWPGLGGRPEIAGDWNTNVDIHDLDEPLRLTRRVTFYNDLYKSIIEQDSKKLAAIMTAHVRVDQYRDNCPSGLNIVTFCKRIVEEGIRQHIGAEDVVVLSDDVAYLRAVRSEMQPFGNGLKKIFDAGHDIAIISSTVPYARRGRPFCPDGKYSVDCRSDAISEGLEKFYELDLSAEMTRNSIRRILAWKYRVYRNLLGEDQADEWLRGNYSPVEVNHLDLAKEMTENTRKTLQESVLLIGPAFVEKNEVAAKLSIQNNGEIFCVGPTLNINDLEGELVKEFGTDRVTCIDLPYSSVDLAKPGEVVASLYKEIEQELRLKQYSFVIFGLVNKPAHVELLNEVIALLEDDSVDSKNAKLVIVAFNSPGVLEDLKVLRPDDYMFATFSNIQTANSLLVDVLVGTHEPATAEALPVKIGRLQIDNVVEQERPEIVGKKKWGGYIDISDENSDRIKSVLVFAISFVFLYKVLHASVWVSLISVTLGAIVFVTAEENKGNLGLPGIDVEGVWPFFGPLVAVMFSYLFLLTLIKLAPARPPDQTGENGQDAEPG